MFMWLYNQTGIETQERSAAHSLGIALHEARNRNQVTRTQRALISATARASLNAANPYARRLWAREFCKAIEAHFALDESKPYPDKELSFITIADMAGWTPRNHYDTDLEEIIDHLRSGLQGLDYAGFVEPGLYVNLAPGVRFKAKSGVSWHCHVFSWTDREIIQARVKQLCSSAQFLPIADGVDAAHQQRATPERLPSLIRYAAKSPRAVYRIYKDEFESSNGEVLLGFRQSKTRNLRPGERIILMQHLVRTNLDQLTIAGGEGVQILKAMNAGVQD